MNITIDNKLAQELSFGKNIQAKGNIHHESKSASVSSSAMPNAWQRSSVPTKQLTPSTNSTNYLQRIGAIPSGQEEVGSLESLHNIIVGRGRGGAHNTPQLYEYIRLTKVSRGNDG